MKWTIGQASRAGLILTLVGAAVVASRQARHVLDVPTVGDWELLPDGSSANRWVPDDPPADRLPVRGLRGADEPPGARTLA